MLPTLEVQLTREYLMRQRDAYLAMVDNIERILDMTPRTAELRKEHKRERTEIQVDYQDKKNVVK